MLFSFAYKLLKFKSHGWLSLLLLALGRIWSLKMCTNWMIFHRFFQVTKDQQTWRAEFKADGDAPPIPQAPAPKAKVAAAIKARGPPTTKYESHGFKWSVQDYIEGVTTVEVADPKQSVYIYNCGAATIDIKGKGKSVILDGCKKTQVLLDEMISSVEVVNSVGVKVQVRKEIKNSFILLFPLLFLS